ncbi:hypothetical protein [Rufibacter radiotolerans]|nr:hypothetical protein [Rufibacter radiotolerans]
MNRSCTLSRFCALLLLCLPFTACDLINPAAPDPLKIDEDLHLSFKTPDWGTKMDCTQLDLPSYGLNTQTYYTFGTSVSSNNTFFLSFPKDSSAMVLPANLKKYPVQELGNHTLPFQFSMKVPVLEGSRASLISKEGLSTDSYNEVVAVKYVGRSGPDALFQIKGRYKMQMVEVNAPNAPKLVSGTYHLKVKTTRL